MRAPLSKRERRMLRRFERRGVPVSGRPARTEKRALSWRIADAWAVSAMRGRAVVEFDGKRFMLDFAREPFRISLASMLEVHHA